MKTKSIFSAIIIIFFLCCASAITAAATRINVDGKICNSEWSDEQSTVLFNKDSSNCDLLIATYKYKIDYKEPAIYFAAKCQTKSPINDSLIYGVELILNGERIRTTADGISIYNDYKYSCDSAFDHSDFGFQVEMRIGIKDDMLNKYNAELRFIDAEGSFTKKNDIVLWCGEENTTKNNYKPENTTVKQKPEKTTEIQKPEKTTAKQKPEETKQEKHINRRQDINNISEPPLENTSAKHEKNNLPKNDSTERDSVIAIEAVHYTSPDNQKKISSSKELIIISVAAMLIIFAVVIIIIGTRKGTTPE